MEKAAAYAISAFLVGFGLWIVCAENLNTGVVTMKSAQDGA
jgi:hypothetical protein